MHAGRGRSGAATTSCLAEFPGAGLTMAIVLALGSAIVYGAADFLGGLLSRRWSAITVAFLSQILGAVPLMGALLLLSGGEPTTEALAWGAGAGVAGAAGVTMLYRGLATGRMSVVAPVTAVEAAAIPVIFGLIAGERPKLLALSGVALALVAVALVSRSPEEESAPSGAPRIPPGLLAGLGAGLSFGAFFILLERAPDTSGLWPLVGTRTSSLVVLGALALATKAPLRVTGRPLAHIAATGAMDVTANVLFLLASRRGLLSLVAVITSMYPASTVALARLTLGERVTRVQAIGLACAIVAVAMISLA